MDLLRKSVRAYELGGPENLSNWVPGTELKHNFTKLWPISQSNNHDCNQRLKNSYR